MNVLVKFVVTQEFFYASLFSHKSIRLDGENKIHLINSMKEVFIKNFVQYKKFDQYMLTL